MGIGLVANIKDDFVRRRIKDKVKRNGEINNAKAWGKMPPGTGDGLNDFAANLGCQLRQRFSFKAFYICRGSNIFEQGIVVIHGKNLPGLLVSKTDSIFSGYFLKPLTAYFLPGL
jgi:hypothetical protein